MNCESCEEPKNSFSAATTGRMLMIVWGVIVSTSSVVIRSRTTRSMVEADAERLLDQLAGGAQAPVPEVLVLVELGADGPRSRPIASAAKSFESSGTPSAAATRASDEREDVLRRDTAVVGHVDAETLIQLVAADFGQVVALRVEEEGLQQVAGVVEVGACRGAASRPRSAPLPRASSCPSRASPG